MKFRFIRFVKIRLHMLINIFYIYPYSLYKKDDFVAQFISDKTYIPPLQKGSWCFCQYKIRAEIYFTHFIQIYLQKKINIPKTLRICKHIWPRNISWYMKNKLKLTLSARSKFACKCEKIKKEKYTD